MNILSRRPTIHTFFFLLVLWSIQIFWDSELVGFCLMWAKIITIKRTKDLNYLSLCANLSWITEINEPFHNILIYWDGPVLIYSSKNTQAGLLFSKSKCTLSLTAPTRNPVVRRQIQIIHHKNQTYRKALGFARGSFWFLYLYVSQTPRIWNKQET